jgi:hypothetical protein
MKQARLQDMVRGWFVGDFAPSALRTDACEVAFKRYAAGEAEATHHHRIATEVTLVASGKVRMLGRDWGAGDIIVIEPGEATDFLALTEASTVVVKLPSVPRDKYPGDKYA